MPKICSLLVMPAALASMQRCFVIAIALAATTANWAMASDDVEAIKLARAQSNEAIARHDIEAIQSFLHRDYVITISSGAIERSRAAHGESFAAHFEAFPDVTYVRTPTSVLISEAYPLAIEHGTWVGTRTTQGGKLRNGGQYTAAWRKVGDTWRIYSELFVALHCDGTDC